MKRTISTLLLVLICLTPFFCYGAECEDSCSDPVQLARMSPAILGASSGVAAGECDNFELICENFEETGTPSKGTWTEVNTPSYDNTVSPIRGAQDLLCDAALDSATVAWATDVGNVWIHFRIYGTFTTTRQNNAQIQDSAGGLLAQIAIQNDGTPQISHGTITYSTTGDINDITDYHVWMHYVKDTGGEGARNGVLDVYISTNGTRGSATMSISTGNATADARKFRMVAGTGQSNVHFDQVYISASEIGNVSHP